MLRLLQARVVSSGTNTSVGLRSPASARSRDDAAGVEVAGVGRGRDGFLGYRIDTAARV